MPVIESNPYLQTFTLASSEKLLPKADRSKLFQNPEQCLILQNVDNPLRSTIANQMALQLENLKNRESFEVDEIEYLIVLAANLTLHHFYEDEEKQAYYWELMELYDKKIQADFATRLGEKKLALWKEVIAKTYNLVEFYPAAIEAYQDALCLFRKASEPSFILKIKSCYLSLIELHVKRASKYSQDNVSPDNIYQEYCEAANIVKEAFKVLKDSDVAREKFVYYHGQIEFFMASHQYDQGNHQNAIKHLYSAIPAFLSFLIATNSISNQNKLLNSLNECIELFEKVKDSVKENSLLLPDDLFIALKTAVLNEHKKVDTTSTKPIQKEDFKNLLEIFNKAKNDFILSLKSGPSSNFFPKTVSVITPKPIPLAIAPDIKLPTKK